MSEYKRLSDRAIDIINELHRERLDYETEYIPLIEAANRLAELEDEIESSQLVELPCKVGDVFFGFPNKTDAPNQYFKYTVKGIEYREDGVYLRTNYDMCFKYGDEAFMTEAEARLKELKGEK